VTLNRVKALNALNMALIRVTELNEVLRLIDANKEIRVIVCYRSLQVSP